MKGIILAGGSGTRLYPLTFCLSKQLLPVYDKPMIYYPLSVLMMAKIKDILIISTPHDVPVMQSFLGDGSKFGLRISYQIQEYPDGIAQAFILGEKFIGKDSCALVLGDNIFYGAGLVALLNESTKRAQNGIASVFGYYVNDPKRFGIVEFDSIGNAISIEEKPKKPKSNYCVTGLYFYPSGVANKAKKVKKSERGEFEITDLNNMYLKEHSLHVAVLGRGFSWIDAGTHNSLLEASNYIKTVEEHQGLKICCPEEISFNNGWISKKDILKEGVRMKNNQYGQHLLNVAKGKIIS